MAAAFVAQRDLVGIGRQQRGVGAGLLQQRQHGGQVALQHAAQGAAAVQAAAVALQHQGELGLLHLGALAQPAGIEAQEPAVLGREVGGQGFAGGERVEQGVAQLRELRFLRGGKFSHRPPPNTSTPRNKQGGAACPTRMIWFGSPLPQ
ncbi:MAG: hypothetical protein QM777_21015 [Pseudorhodoferax sp.]